MRIYHKAYRNKNPSRKASIKGDKKKVHNELIRILQSPSRKKNPGESIEAFNVLGNLNAYIADERAKASDSSLSEDKRKAAAEKAESFIALRNTVQARIKGNLERDTLEYSLSEALRDLSAAEVKVLKRLIAEAGGEVSPEKGKDLRAQVGRDPEVIRLQKRVDRARDLEAKTKKLVRAAIRRNQMSMVEWGRGELQHAQIKSSDASAREEIGDEVYIPADRDLWNRAKDVIAKKHPEGYVPPRLVSKRRDELKLLIEMSHLSTPASRKKEIRYKLETAFRNRLKTKTILTYEKLGGKPLSEAERQKLKRSASQRMQKLGEPFKVGPNFYGVVSKSGSDFKWALVDARGRVHFSGKAASKKSSSKNIGISFRILESLVTMDKSRVGWDELSANDRRWLESNYPDISEKVAKLMLKNINKRIKVTKETAYWLMKAGGLGQFEKTIKEGIEKMGVGEERIISGVDGDYSIHIKRGAKNIYTMWVVTSDGRESQRRRIEGLKKAISRGHAIGGAMSGASRVTGAVRNPAKIRKLNADARRFFAKKNPDFPKVSAEEADIKELAGMFRIPRDPEDAYRYGLYFGIIRGIDTCGVQNYMKRKRIRKKYEKRIFEGMVSESSRAGGLRDGGLRSKRSRKKSEYDEDILSILDTM